MDKYPNFALIVQTTFNNQVRDGLLKNGIESLHMMQYMNFQEISFQKIELNFIQGILSEEIRLSRKLFSFPFIMPHYAHYAHYVPLS